MANEPNKVKNVHTASEVEYQWHWQRILLAFFVLVGFIATGVFAMQSPSSTELNHIENVIIKGNSVLPEKPEINSIELKAETDSVQNRHILDESNKVESHSENKQLDRATRDSITTESTVLTASEQSDRGLSDIALGVKINTQSVSRALLTRDIKAREPVDIIGERIARASFTTKLYFFTEVHGLNNKTVHHRWYFDGQLQADVALSIYAVRYRTYSSKNIAALQLGLWRVELVVDDNVLASKEFIVTDQ